MFELTLYQDLVGFASFVSSSYGTGNLVLDIGITCSALMLAVLIVRLLTTLADSNRENSRGNRCLAKAADSLTCMSLQLSELKSSVRQEFEKCRGEMGFIKQELAHLRHSLPTAKHDSLGRRETQARRKDPVFEDYRIR